MLEREVLAGRAAPGLVLTVLGAAMVLLSFLTPPHLFGVLAGLAWLGVGVHRFVSRHNVLDAGGVKPAGSVYRRIPWSEVHDVRRSTTARHDADVEIHVRGQRRPVLLPERRAGADLAAVQAWWHADRTPAARGTGGTRLAGVAPDGTPEMP